MNRTLALNSVSTVSSRKVAMATAESIRLSEPGSDGCVLEQRAEQPALRHVPAFLDGQAILGGVALLAAGPEMEP